MQWVTWAFTNHQIWNKSSVVAEIGDRARAKWAEKWGGAAVPLSGRSTKWHLIHPAVPGHNSHGPNIGVCCAPVLGWPGSPSNTMSPGLPSGILIHPAVWPQETWAKNWTAVPLLGEGELSPHLTQCDLSRGLHTILISKCFVRTAPSFKNST